MGIDVEAAVLSITEALLACVSVAGAVCLVYVILVGYRVIKRELA